MTSALLRHRHDRKKNMTITITYYNHPSTVQVASDGLLFAKNEKLPFRASVFNDKSGCWCQGIPVSL